MKEPIVAVCKDIGGMNGIVPVVRELKKRKEKVFLYCALFFAQILDDPKTCTKVLQKHGFKPLLFWGKSTRNETVTKTAPRNQESVRL